MSCFYGIAFSSFPFLVAVGRNVYAEMVVYIYEEVTSVFTTARVHAVMKGQYE